MGFLAMDAAVGADGKEGSSDALHPAGGQPTEAWMRTLWARLSKCADLAPLGAWPLLPVRGGWLRALQAPSRVVAQGNWSENILSMLSQVCDHLSPRGAM